MRVKQKIVSELIPAVELSWFREEPWNDRQFLWGCLVRLEHGDAQAWTEFVQYVLGRRELVETLGQLLAAWDYLGEDESPWATNPFLTEWIVNPLIVETPEGQEIADLLQALVSAARQPSETLPSSQKRTTKSKSEIMYVEAKPGLTGPGRIGRVRFSKTGKTIYYRERTFQSLKGGYKCNYFDVESREEYWISGCRKDGLDTLYPGIVDIDDDVREEYWQTIRKLSDKVAQKSFRSEGKYRR